MVDGPKNLKESLKNVYMDAYFNPIHTSPGDNDSKRWLFERVGDGAVVIISDSTGAIEPDNWLSLLNNTLKSSSGIAVVGAKRLNESGKIFSMGEFVVHPKGFHYLGRDLEAHNYRFPEEVDVISGGVFLVDEQWFDKVGGSEMLHGDLGALTLCLSLRAAGKRCVSIPHVIAFDNYEPKPDPQEESLFLERWGFDWRAPDLDEIRKLYEGSGLLWNVRLHSKAMSFDKYDRQPACHWKTYSREQHQKQRADHITHLIMEECHGGRLLDLGCGDGLYSHLSGLGKVEAIGIDPEKTAIEQAAKMTQGQHYPSKAPRFLVGAGTQIPFKEASFDMVAMLDVIEHLPNPVAVLREIGRVLKSGGLLLIATPSWIYGGWSDVVYHVTEYRQEELARQIETVTNLKVYKTLFITGRFRDILVFARKT